MNAGEMFAGATGSFIFLFIGLFLVLLAMLWFLLPFAVFGIKGRMDDMLMEMKFLTKEVAAIRAEASSGEPQSSGPSDEKASSDFSARD